MTTRRAALVALVAIVALVITLWWVSQWRDARIGSIINCIVEQDRDSDVDGNGVVDWHDRYVFDHCQRCPECCVNEADFKDDAPSGLDRIAEEAFCTPDVCPGKCCYCVKDDDGVWWIDETRFGTDDDPDCGIPIPVDEDEDSGCGEGEGKDEGINR